MTAQLDLTLPKTRACYSLRRSRPSRARAAFWFHRMRQIVDAAAEWSAAPGLVPEKHLTKSE